MSRWLYNWPPTKRYFPLTLSTKQCRALGPLIQLRSPLRRCSTLLLLSGRFDHFTCDVAAPSSCVMGLYVLLSELGSLVHTITKRRRGNFGSRCPGICMNTSVACPMRKHFSVWTGVHGDKRVAVTNNLISSSDRIWGESSRVVHLEGCWITVFIQPIFITTTRALLSPQSACCHLSLPNYPSRRKPVSITSCYDTPLTC